jgi:molecular chaperone DnaJ
VIGVPPQSDIEVIKKAYRKLLLRYHPDRSEASVEENQKFLKIKNAYDEVVSYRKKHGMKI